MRSALCEALKATGTDFGFIVDQVGMFSYSGLSIDVVRKLRADKGLYIVDSGRICVAAINQNNMTLLPFIYRCCALVNTFRGSFPPELGVRGHAQSSIGG